MKRPASAPLPLRFRPLYPSDRKALALLAEGFDNAEIAQRMGVSYASAGAAVSRVYQKLGVSKIVSNKKKRKEVVRIAIERGLIDPSGSNEED